MNYCNFITMRMKPILEIFFMCDPTNILLHLIGLSETAKFIIIINYLLISIPIEKPRD